MPSHYSSPAVFVNRTPSRGQKKYKVFPVSSQALLAVFYAAAKRVLFHGHQTPRLRLTADQRTVSCDRQLTYVGDTQKVSVALIRQNQKNFDIMR